MSTYTVTPVGGTSWTVSREGEHCGTIESGTIDSDGQWTGDYDDVEAEARKAFGIPDHATVEVD